MDEMWRPRGEDDGSLLSQMTEDAAEAGAAVRHYHKAYANTLPGRTSFEGDINKYLPSASEG